MTLLLAAPFLATVALVALAGASGAGVRPKAAAWSLTAGATAVAVSTTGALALLAWPLVARLGPVAQLGRWRSDAVGRGVAIPILVSAAALLALVVVAVSLLRWAWRLASEVRRLGSVHRTLAASDADAVLVVRDQEPLAYAAPALTSSGGRTVISAGLIDVLDADECEAVVAHERAHLDHYHHLFTVLIDGAVALNPALRPVAVRARFEVERWADEVAAATTSRSTTASALAKTAIARLQHLHEAAAVHGLGLHVEHHRVTDRVEALLDDAPGAHSARPLRILLIPAAALLALAWAAHDMEGTFEAIRRLR